LKITVLAENTSNNETFRFEHGLSLYIETAKHKILFDTGQSSLFAENAVKMGIDLREADIAILSHGHYDHGGGIKAFLDLNSKAPLFLSKYAFEPHYNANDKYIGLDVSIADCDRLVYTEDILIIDDELTLHSCNDMERKYDSSSGLSVMTDGKLIPDDFRHEQYLMINENNKQVLISGCSHKGILNITHWMKPDVLIGGFHLSKTDDTEMLNECANKLLDTPTSFYTCHCTGVKQFEYLRSIVKERLNYISTGDMVIIPEAY